MSASFQYVRLCSPTGHPEEVQLNLSTGEALGHVQRFEYSISVGEYARCSIETIASAEELIALARDTELRVQLDWRRGKSPLTALWAYYSTKARIAFGAFKRRFQPQ